MTTFSNPLNLMNLTTASSDLLLRQVPKAKPVVFVRSAPINLRQILPYVSSARIKVCNACRNERYCARCEAWRPDASFRDGQDLCQTCQTVWCSLCGKSQSQELYAPTDVKTLVYLGDGITSGLGASDDMLAYPALLQENDAAWPGFDEVTVRALLGEQPEVVDLSRSVR